MRIVKNIILILTFILAFACGSQRIDNLSNLTIENKNSNKLIENRIPDYGIDGGDGCVVMNEISMNIIDLKEDYIHAKVFDSETSEPLLFGTIILYINKESKIDTLILKSDNSGFFTAEFNGELTNLDVSYIGYRTLKVDLNKA